MLSMDHAAVHAPQEMDVTPPAAPAEPTPASEESAAKPEEYPEDANLFVGDLARNVKEMTLHHVFSKFGTVVSVDIKRDKITKNSLGYGFVQFAERTHAENAKRELHRFTIGGRSIRIGWAQKNTNLFIGDLDPEVTSEQLRQVFGKYGPLYEDETFVKHRNYGFVRFKNRGDAERAKREMDGQMLGARPIRIGWGDAHVLLQKCCVHVQFDPSAAMTEEMLREAFREYGEVLTISLPRNGGVLKGFGFVHYRDSADGESAAAKAMAEITRVGGVDIKCNYGKRQSRNKNRAMHARAGSLMYMSPYGAAYGAAYGTPYGATYGQPMFVPMDAHSAAAWSSYAAAQWWMYGVPYAPPNGQGGWNPYSNQYAVMYPMEGAEYYAHAHAHAPYTPPPPHAQGSADAASAGGRTDAAGKTAAAPTPPITTTTTTTVAAAKKKSHTSKAVPIVAPPTAGPAGAVVSPAKSGADAPATRGEEGHAKGGVRHKKKKQKHKAPQK